MVLGSYYTQTGYLKVEPIIVSIPVGILVASVLLIDSIRDYEYDRSAGIKTLTVMLGRDVALKLFTTMIAIAYVATPLIYSWYSRPMDPSTPYNNAKSDESSKIVL